MQDKSGRSSIANLSTPGQAAVILIIITVIFVAIPAGAAVQQESSDEEANDKPENAVRLNFSNTSMEGITEAYVSSSYNQTEDSSARFESGDEEDWYAFDVKAGQIIRFWGSASRTFDVDGTLVGPEKEVLASNEFIDEVTSTGMVAEKTGTYYVQVSNETEILGGEDPSPIPYKLSIQVANPDSFEPNDNPNVATPITPGETFTGVITNDSKSDWFRIDMSSGDGINATIRTNVKGGPALPILGGGTSVDIFSSNSSRIGVAVDLKIPNSPSNTTNNYQGRYRVATMAKPEEVGYIRVRNDITKMGFAPYSLTVSMSDSEDPSPDDLPNNLTIESTSSERASYNFTVNGQVKLGKHANPVEATVPDSVSGNSASGSVAQNGVDDYHFTGKITNFSLEGPANLYVNSKQINTNNSPAGTLPATPSTISTSIETTTHSPIGPVETRLTNTTLAGSTSTEVTSSESSTRTHSPENDSSPTSRSGGEESAATAAQNSNETDAQGPGFGFLMTILAICLLVVLGMRSQVE